LKKVFSNSRGIRREVVVKGDFIISQADGYKVDVLCGKSISKGNTCVINIAYIHRSNLEG